MNPRCECGHGPHRHSGIGLCLVYGCLGCSTYTPSAREPSDDEIYNRPGVEGGIPYTNDEPGSLGENDFRL